MTEPNTLATDDEVADALNKLTKSERQVTSSRRRLLETLTVGGSFVLAGCGQSDSTTPTGPSGGASTVSGQSFRAPIGQEPAKTTVYVSPLLASYLRTTFATIVKENASTGLQQFIKEPAVWADGYWASADVHYNLLEDPIEITPSEVTVTLRDDARWSDGSKITGKDIAVDPLQRHIWKLFPPYYADDGQKPPEYIWAAIDDITISDQSVTYRSSPGHFEQFWDVTIRTRLASFNHFTGAPRFLPTHIEPYESYADAVIETAKRAQEGELKPWSYQSGDPDLKSLAKKHLGKRQYVEKFSKPANVLAAGAWDLVELRGTKAFVFEKNPHHRNADAINFEKLILEYTPSDDRQRAALRGDRLDYGSVVTPQSVVESFPDHLTQLQIPGGLGTGNELALNFDHPALGNRNVRAALMYALDQSAIAANIHRSTAVPIDTPGGDCWDATEYVSREWINTNLRTYTTNREKAAALMRDAGYTKNGGQWVNADGEPFTLTLPTPRSIPLWEPTVASQLSQFGIKTSVRTLNATTFSDRVDRGEFPLWPAALNATNVAPATLLIWFYAPSSHQQYGIYPDAQFETGEFSAKGVPTPKTEDRWRVFTIQAPPIGQPNGARKSYHPSALSLFVLTNPLEAEVRRRVKTGLWLANWFLPTIPINKTKRQHFVDHAHWEWPRDTQSWNAFTKGRPRTVHGILAGGNVRATPDDSGE